MKFVVDAMLGKVALWLRLTGHDTVYEGDIEDDNALIIAEKENRVLLTSDEELYNRAQNRNIDSMLVRGAVDDEVADVFYRFGINPHLDPSHARCSKCNGELEELKGESKHKIKEMVFEQTYNTYDVFWFCNECDSVFFQGGYWDNMTRYMMRIEKLIENYKNQESTL